MYDLICALHEANLNYLNARQEIVLPVPYQPETNTGQWVSPSRLGYCPAVRWHEIHATPNTVQIPNWKREKNLHRMHHGTVWGRELQKAFAVHFGLMTLDLAENRRLGVTEVFKTWHALDWWMAGERQGYVAGDFAPEVYVQNAAAGLRGFIDGVVRFNGELWLVEIKTRDYGQGVKKNDVFQLLAYFQATGCANGMIITTGHSGFKCWPVTPEGTGFLVRSEGQAEPVDEDWNTPDQLNFATLAGEIQRHRHVLDLDVYHRPEAPLNPLDLDNFECLEWVQKPRWFKTKAAQDGTFVPACPYFGLCHPSLADYPTLVVGINANNCTFLKPTEGVLEF